MIVEISIVAATVAFVALVLYLLFFLRTAKASLDQLTLTLVETQKDLNILTQETTQLIQTSRALAQNVDEKLHEFDSIIYSAKQTGQAIEQVTHSARQVSAVLGRSAANVQASARKSSSRISEWFEYATLGIQFWQKWRTNHAARASEKQNLNL